VINVNIDFEDLLKWGRFMETVPRKTPAALARALNTVGDNVLRTSVEYLSDSTGLATNDIEPMITVHRATPSNLEWSMDASAITLNPSPNWQRPWESPGDNTFNTNQLLNIVTSGDDTVCPICEQAAENSPYTVADINALAAKWANYTPPHPVVGERTNLIHPNCRCVTQPWNATRRLRVEFPDRPAHPPTVLTMRQLGEAVAEELGAVLKAVP
jgi:hypothetical protein